MGKMDALDRLLYRLPQESPDGEMADRVLHSIWRKQRRRMVLRYGMNLALVLTGLYLSLPLWITLPASVDLPKSGLPLAWSWVESSLTRPGVSLSSLWSGMLHLQDGMVAPITFPVFLGLAGLAVGALLTVIQMLPRRTASITPANEGVSA